MKEQYIATEVEKNTRKRWLENDSFTVQDDDPRPKYYSLCMWPYPSGDLHVGHLRNYTLGDVWARHKRMEGFNVLQPMGWDAFGRDAELKARKEGIHPSQWVKSNTTNMRRELFELGYMVDWKRELASCNPLFYYWEQLLFLKMWEKDLIYYAPTKVLWDKSTDTVVSRRDVDDGKINREHVEVKEMHAYQMRMRNYGNELLEGLEDIKWPDKIVKDQQYLIGRSEGLSIKFKLKEPVADINTMEVYTTRPDTLMGVTYMAVHASHPLAKHAAKSNEKLCEFCEQCEQVLPMDAGNAESDKKGIALGVNVINPLSGKEIPVWVADYVIDDYGSGALMGVPAHDDRDFNFATKYELPIIRVCAKTLEEANAPLETADVIEGIAVNSGPLDGLDKNGCTAKIEELLKEEGLAKRDFGMSLRDWPINRRMYWGTPIPIVKCEKCGLVPIPENQLPLELPLDVNFLEEDLSAHPKFNNVECPKCKGNANREYDTMDTFVNSSWYYARFTCRDSKDAIVEKSAASWLPCDHYFGGDEHAQGHLVYSRFIHKVMRDLKMIDADCGDEPFKSLLCQGMVLGADCKKMSKSQGNTVMAKEILEKYGADIARMYIIGIGNPKDAFPWNEEHIHAHAIFLDTLWQQASEQKQLVLDGTNKQPAKKLEIELKKLMYSIDMNITEQRFNNLVFGGVHSIRNLLKNNNDDAGFVHQGYSVLLKVLNLISPHVAEELWSELGFQGLLIDATWWPKVALSETEGDTRTYVVQINGKRRDEFEATADLDDETILESASKLVNVSKHLEGLSIKSSKVIRRSGSHGIVFFVAKP